MDHLEPKFNPIPRKRGRKPSNELSPQQLRTLQAVKEFTETHGYPPSIIEVADLRGIKGPSVYDQIRQLIRKGYLERDPKKARGLIVVHEPTSSLFRIVPIPVVGRVAAGVPILADQNITSEILVDEKMLRSGTYFALEVRGDSMINAGIQNGDLVIVRQQPTCGNGDIVVALLGDEATVKRLYHVGDHIELRAENPRYAPIVAGPEDDLRIMGKVVGIRNMGST